MCAGLNGAPRQAPLAWMTSTMSRLRLTLSPHTRLNSATKRLSSSGDAGRFLCALVGRGQMALQIHRVMKQAQDLDHVTVLIMSDPEHDEMTPFAPLASDMK